MTSFASNSPFAWPIVASTLPRLHLHSLFSLFLPFFVSIHSTLHAQPLLYSHLYILDFFLDFIFPFSLFLKHGKEGKGREEGKEREGGKGRKGKGRVGKEREGKGRKGKGMGREGEKEEKRRTNGGRMRHRGERNQKASEIN